MLEINDSMRLTPSLGSSESGTPVEIFTRGPYCTTPTCPAPVITFGGVPAKDVRVVSASYFYVTAPPHEDGAVEVRVEGPAATFSSYAFRYFHRDEPPLPQLFERVLFR